MDGKQMKIEYKYIYTYDINAKNLKGTIKWNRYMSLLIILHTVD